MAALAEVEIMLLTIGVHFWLNLSYPILTLFILSLLVIKRFTMEETPSVFLPIEMIVVILANYLFLNSVTPYFEDLVWLIPILVALIIVGVATDFYVMNQCHMLSENISHIVNYVLFWPTVPVTIFVLKIKKRENWFTVIDDSVVLGCAPFSFWPFTFWGYPEYLYNNYNVRGVVNFCREYEGPIGEYKRLGIEQRRLPTTDHFEPSVEQLEETIEFIDQYRQRGQRVYVHCKAGHGRSAAGVLAWLLRNERDNENHRAIRNEAENVQEYLQYMNMYLYEMRKVRKKLWQQPSIGEFYNRMEAQ